jgi:glutathione S-transferase
VKGLADQIELMPTLVDPLQPPDLLIAVNPLGKIPVLVLGDGSALYGSTVIAEYLDAIDGAPLFFPAANARWPALRRNALADGVLEAGMLARTESLRPLDKQWADWREAQVLKIRTALNVLEREASLMAPETLTIGDVAVICALGWLDVRLPELQWRKTRPALAEWFAEVSRQPAVERTAPQRSKN